MVAVPQRKENKRAELGQIFVAEKSKPLENIAFDPQIGVDIE